MLPLDERAAIVADAHDRRIEALRVWAAELIMTCADLPDSDMHRGDGERLTVHASGDLSLCGSKCAGS